MLRTIRNFIWSAICVLFYWSTGMVGLYVLLCICSCSTPKKTAEQKAYDARQEEIKTLQKLRELFPCDTITREVVRVDTTVIAADTVRKDSTIWITLPGKVITTEIVKTVIDRSKERELRDSLENEQYMSDQMMKSLQDQLSDRGIENDKLKKEIAQLSTKTGELRQWKTAVTALLAGVFVYFGFSLLKRFGLLKFIGL